MEHWRKIVHTDYIAGDELVNKEGEYSDFTLTIKEVTSKEVVDPRTGVKKPCGVIYFNEIKKGMILNVINGKTISQVIGTPFKDYWIGKKIIIHGKEDKRHGRVVRVKLKKVI